MFQAQHAHAPDAEATPANDPRAADDTPVCSARGCRAPARHALCWNNPKLHDPERRKTWLACETHLTTLGDFLTARGFLREVVPVNAP